MSTVSQGAVGNLKGLSVSLLLLLQLTQIFLYPSNKKIEFIQFEAGELDQNPHEYDEEELDFLAENDDFIDDESVQEQSEEPRF